MVCGETYRKDPAGQARLMAEGLKRLWNVNLTGCPGDWRLEHKLAQAGEAVKRPGRRIEHLADGNNRPVKS